MLHNGVSNKSFTAMPFNVFPLSIVCSVLLLISCSRWKVGGVLMIGPASQPSTVDMMAALCTLILFVFPQFIQLSLMQISLRFDSFTIK